MFCPHFGMLVSPCILKVIFCTCYLDKELPKEVTLFLACLWFEMCTFSPPINLELCFFLFFKRKTALHHLLLLILCIFVLTMSEEVLKLLSLWSLTALWRSGSTSQVFWHKSRTYLLWMKSDISEDQAVWICFCLYYNEINQTRKNCLATSATKKIP